MEPTNIHSASKRTAEGTRKSTRKPSIGEDPTSTSKKRRHSSDDNMSNKNKKNTSDMNPTNAQLMSTLDKLAEKMDELPSKHDLKNVEEKLTSKIHQNAVRLDKKIQDNTRSIGSIHKRLDLQVEAIAKLEKEVETQKKRTQDGHSVAVTKRKEAREDRYQLARRSFRIWPVKVNENEDPVVCVRRFLIIDMKVPATLAKDVGIESVKKAVQGQARSKIHDEMIVTFELIEGRDAVKSYANGFAGNEGRAGLRLEIPEHLKGSLRILEEHALAIRNLYGRDTKRNVNFDDRNMDLMVDIKLPSSQKWHNVTIEQAKKAKQMREEKEIAQLSNGKPVLGGDEDKERAKVLMLVYTPQKANPKAAATSANLIDIEASFQNNEQEPSSEHEEDSSDSDASMSRLLHGERR